MAGRNERTDNVTNVDPIFLRMYGGHHDEPWSAMRVTDHNGPNSDRSSSFSGSTMNFRQYRKQPGSDLESIVGPRSDSGYYTHPAPHSVMSNEPERADQELPNDMFQLPNLNVSSAPSESTEKHMLKHDKPHACDVSGCRRAAQGKGFTTINDLQRHKKSVHRIGVERDSYQCASEHCRNRGKIWPRLDNFKQHISRMHKDEDEQELIRKSSYQGPIPPSAVTPTDITLAGIGIEGQVGAGNELDDPASGISLTPDQDHNPWISFDPAQKFSLEVDRMNPRESDQFLSAPSTRVGLDHDRQTGNLAPSPDTYPRTRQDSLKVLADVASIQPPPSAPSQRQLSSAPQTKAEQQRQITHAEQQRMALQKFGKALIAEIHADPSADGTDLENAVLRVLSGTAQQRRKESIPANLNHSTDELDMGDSFLDLGMTKTEALKASQAISNLIKQSSRSPFTSQSRRSSRVSSSEKLKCNHCGVVVSRACDMKKHMKRHTKPYGCTYPKCHKRFGAKSDWKRHENSQHFQLESFRCQMHHSALRKPCGELFYRVELFKQHLESEHKVVEDADIQDEVRARRIGKNGQGQFWCGFCQDIVKLKEKRNAAWDERFDHIDKHFNKERRGIEEWVCVEARKTKGEILKEMDRTSFDEEDGDEDGEGEPDDSPSGNVDVDVDEHEHEHDHAYQAYAPAPAPLEASRKRQFPVEDAVSAPVPKRRRKDVDRYC
ncbi:hypothetical protein N0V90_012577 [Kalmusia sp. IMI 367209]|nr:hypothetical protein N0V90_012577 [Kalmusia sp. IMI 367209]